MKCFRQHKTFFLFSANDVLLSHMITFLNDKNDKQLRISFFKCIVGVATYIGVHSSPILSPLLLQVSRSKETITMSFVREIWRTINNITIYLLNAFTASKHFKCCLGANNFYVGFTIHCDVWIQEMTSEVVISVSKWWQCSWDPIKLLLF